MSLLNPNKDDEAFAQAHAEAGFRMRVAWVKKLRAELERLAKKYPNERAKIEKVLAETEEWL
jgi:ParB-like chromosome segregation protein Spo0J